MHTHIFCVNKSITIVWNCLRATEGKDGGERWVATVAWRPLIACDSDCVLPSLASQSILSVSQRCSSWSGTWLCVHVYLHVNVCCVHEIHALYWRHWVFHTLLQSQNMFIQKRSMFLETLKIKFSSKPKFCGAFFRLPFLKLPKIHHFLPSAI